MHFQHDDKNTHFVIASTIAPADQPFIFPGGMQRTNLQSQSFPDLSRKIDLRSMKGGGGGGGGGNVRPMYKSSRLPVASRYVNKRNSRCRLNQEKLSRHLDSLLVVLCICVPRISGFHPWNRISKCAASATPNPNLTIYSTPAIEPFIPTKD